MFAAALFGDALPAMRLIERQRADAFTRHAPIPRQCAVSQHDGGAAVRCSVRSAQDAPARACALLMMMPCRYARLFVDSLRLRRVPPCRL